MKSYRKVCALAAAFALISVLAFAQKDSRSASFTPYTSCHMAGGPNIVDVAPLDPGIKSRSVQTLAGYATIPMLDGGRIMFAYPGEDYYANVKVEFLPAASYADSKAALSDNLDYVLASGDSVRNYKLKPKLNGFDMEGIDRSKRKGGVLGMYLMFDDATRTVVTIYFLNQEPPKRFTTMEEYAALRDHFLTGYTTCICAGLRGDH